MRRFVATIVLPQIAALLVVGCSRRDSDVSTSSYYNFSSFAGTVWKTKVPLAIAEIRDYRGKPVLCLEAPPRFDPTQPKYNPPEGMRVISVIPPGSELRVDRLMKDNGNWGGVRVFGVLTGANTKQETVKLDPMLLAKNTFVWPGWSSETNWGVNPEVLTTP